MKMKQGLIVTASLDQRVVKLGIVIDSNITWYEDLYIDIKGIKISSSISGKCEITILT